MDIKTLTTEVLQLRSLGHEGGYWDFKKEWHKDKGELLLDIICMANNLENRDAYIILGISDQTMEVVGVENDPCPFRQLCKLSQFVAKKKFALHIPSIDLHSIELENHEVDVIVIHNTVLTPYYLLDDYSDEEYLRNFCKKGKQLKAGQIYIRLNDSKIGVDRPAPYHYVELLWRKHFGIGLSIMERLHLLLNDTDKWKFDWGNKNYAYHEIFPEFHLQIVGDPQSAYSPSAAFYLDASSYYWELNIMYHSTIIYETTLWSFDGFKIYLPEAKNASPNFIRNFWYSYYDLSSIEGKLFTIFTCGRNNFLVRGGDDKNQFLVFKDQYEQRSFDYYLSNHFNDFSDAEIQEKYRWEIERDKRATEDLLPNYSTFQVAKAAEIYLAWKKVKNENC